MKALLQVGAAQFMVEGATFHLLCRDVASTLRALVPLREADISLTLHTEALERCLADDAQLLTAVTGRPSMSHHRLHEMSSESDHDDDYLKSDPNNSAKGRNERYSYELTQQEREEDELRGGATHLHPFHSLYGDEKERADPMPRRRQSVSLARDPLNIFSAESFDAAEAVVQQLLTRVLEQRLLLESYMSETYSADLNDAKHNVQDDAHNTDKKSALIENAENRAFLLHRVVPLPMLRLVTQLATSAGAVPEYDAEGHRRRSSVTVGDLPAAP